ncbi:MAG: right-handed parallel beta-helix repeat-containing protein, partial [Verrucomicrobiota bacterium]
TAGSEPVVLEGGRRISGWKKYDDKLWVATLLGAANGQWKFRQLFVNGQQRVLARIPNAGFLRVADAYRKPGGRHQPSQKFQSAPGDIRADWLNLTDIEVVVFHFWTDSHLMIKSVDTQSNIVTFAYPANKVFTDDNTTNGARYIVENVFEGLDSPGEWYLNRRTGQLFYYPMPGEDMAKAEVVAPFAPALVRLEGDPAKRRFVEHLRFQNLGFAYSKFELPPGDSNSRQGSASVPAAITLRGARTCAFEQCRIFNLGTFAFDVKEGCSDNQFVGNEIANIAAGGFRVNGGTEKNPPWERTRNNRITDNWLHHYGLDYVSAVGVFLINTDGNTVSHNQIDHGGYTGISVGLVYGYARSVSQNNLIEFNHIHHIGGVLSDMGGIYTLGISPGTTLRNNLIHDVDANHYGGWGIYHDEGSTHLLDENNVVYNTKFAPFHIHFAQEGTVRNNIFAWGKLDQLSRTKVEPHKSVYFENNIVYWRTGELFSGNWKDVPYMTRVTVLAKTTEQPATNTFDCDWNLYFNPTLKLDEVKFNGDTWAAWQQRGKDAHSLYADPLFVAPEQGDFTLKPESPAFALGFQPIDLSQVGPRVKTGPQPGSQ